LRRVHSDRAAASGIASRKWNEQTKKRLIWLLFPSYLLITVVSLIAAASWYASVSMRRFYLAQTRPGPGGARHHRQR
jgi:hypothetical protein